MDLGNSKGQLTNLNQLANFWPLGVVHNTARVFATHNNITNFIYHKCRARKAEGALLLSCAWATVRMTVVTLAGLGFHVAVAQLK